MYERKTIGLVEARKAVEAMIQEASKEPNRPMAVAVLDDRGDLVCFEKMDGASKLFGDMAIRKAYTAVQARNNTGELQERFKSIGASVAWFGPDYTLMWGGQVITEPGEYVPFRSKIYGSIGASGRHAATEDAAMAKLGVKAIQSILWPSK